MPTPQLPDLSVRQLEYLDAVTRAPTWATAAAELGVTPSALSQGLAELERRLGVPLFERQGRRRVPTDAAGPVIDHARRVLNQTADLARWAADRRHGRTGRLRVGMIDAAAVGHHPEALRTFRRQRPDVELHLTVAPSAPLLAQLGRGELDVVVCVEPGTAEVATASLAGEVDLVPLLDEPLAVYGPQGEAGPGRRRGVGPTGWGPWLLFPEGSHTRAPITGALLAEGARVDVVAESHQPEVLREMVRLGMGWTVLPVVQAEHPPDPLRPVRRAALTSRTLVAARRAHALPDPAADALVELLTTGGRPRRPSRHPHRGVAT